MGVELPEDAIEAAEARESAHRHDDLEAGGSMLEHLRSVHGLAAPAHLSPAALAGLHDRMHDETKAADSDTD